MDRCEVGIEFEFNYYSELDSLTRVNPTYENWIQLCLEWYKVSNFSNSKAAAEEAVKVKPDDATGWNNLCAASNKLGDYQRGIESGTKAVELRPEWELAINNLKEAQRLKDAQTPK